MKVFLTGIKRLLLTLNLVAWAVPLCYADGGFPIFPNRLILSPSVSYFFSGSQWNTHGIKKKFPFNRKYHSTVENLYAEFGINNRTAVYLNLPFVVNNYTQDINPTSKTVSGPTYLESGVKYYLAKFKKRDYLSIQGGVITSLFTNKSNLGYGQNGGEVYLNFSGPLRVGRMRTYFYLQEGVRKYIGTNAPTQDLYIGTWGISLDKKLTNQLALVVTGIKSWSPDKRFDSAIPIVNRNFLLFGPALAYIHYFSKYSSVTLRGGESLTGVNIGTNMTASLAYTYRIDYGKAKR